MERSITWIAALVSVVVFVTLPGVYFLSARSNLDATLATEVEINARLVTQIVNANPDLWQFQSERMANLLQNRPGDDTAETRRVFDLNGALIAASDDQLADPVVALSAAVLDSGRVVGRLEIVRSLRPMLLATAAAALAGLVLAATVFIALRVLPLRALRRAINQLLAEKVGAAQLRREKEEAETAARVRSEFLARMSHEIRTPMNGVLGMTELLLETGLNEPQRQCAQTVMTSAKSLLQIIDDILDFSKIGAGKLTLERIEFDPADLVEEVTQMLASTAMQKGLQLDAIVEPGMPALMVGDPARLRQVMTNLIGNAVKFTERGGVVTCARAVAAAEGPLIEITVTDTGIGIAGEQLAHLFDPFAQADTTTSRRFGGTGLGLTIARQLAEAMGGRLTVESRVGAGSTFRLTLPLMQAAAANNADKPARCAWVIAAAENTRRSLLAALARLGVRADAVADIDAARMLARRFAEEEGTPDIVFVDRELAATAREAIAALCDRGGGRRAELVLLAPMAGAMDCPAHREGERVAVKPIRTADLRALLAGSRMQPAAHAADGGKVTGSRAVRPRVLLVEDNAVNQTVAQAMLKQLGVEVTAVANGRQAVDAIADGSFDLVLMDCHMPELDGFEATRIVREKEAARSTRQARLPIVALTANAMSDDRERCLAAGMDDYLSKPYTIAQLKELLDRWLPCSERPEPRRPAPTMAACLPRYID